MGSTAKALLFLLATLVICCTVPIVCAFHLKSGVPVSGVPVFTDRVFYTRFGGVYCGNMEIGSCGIRLWNCADERVYECLHDIAWKDMKP